MPALVQNDNTVHGYGSTDNTVVTFGSATTGGHLLVLAFEYSAYTGAFTISDSSGSNSWVIASPTNANSQDPPCAYDGPDGGLGAFIAWTFSAASVTTVTLATGSKYYAGTATGSEWAGLSAYQSSASAFNLTASGTISPGAVTLATASDVVVGAAYQEFGSSLTPASPLTAFSSDATGYTAYAQPGASGSYTPGWGTASHDWASAAAVFTTGGPAFLAPPNLPRGQAVNRASTY
jgi:hypothetical protein